jgi:hypothetical protein
MNDSVNALRVVLTSLCLLPVIVAIASCGGSDPTGPCSSPVVMSCNGGDNCHEFYSQAAADAIRASCVYLGQVISTSPCPKSLPDCCVEDKGSNDYPEGICLAKGGWDSGCTAKGDTMCKR